MATTPHDLLQALNDGLADGQSAMVVLIGMNTEGRPIELRSVSTPMTAATICDVAQFLVEEAIARAGSDAVMRDGLGDALGALQGVTGIVGPISVEPVIGRA